MIEGIRYYSFIGAGGYGEAALAYIQCLVEQDVPLRWSPLVSTQWGVAPWHMLPADMRPGESEIADGLQDRVALMKNFEQSISYDTVFLHSVPELWPKLVESDKVNIGYTVWETDRLPGHWPDVLKSVDHLCVPCEFNRDLFTIDQGPDISVIPHTARNILHKITDQACRAFKREHGISDDMYIFYIIAAWDPRKAMSKTLHAFLQAFDADENVCLLIKTDEKGCADSSGVRISVEKMVKDIVAEYPNSAKIELIAGRVPESDIQLIHEVGDCFFSLTHSEGWGLGAFDAAASGNPVLITGWGGQLDYLPGDSSYHVRYELRSLEEVRGWESYDRDQNWAYADMEDAIMQLRTVFQNQSEAAEKGQQLKIFTNDRFSTEQVTADLLEAIDEAHS